MINIIKFSQHFAYLLPKKCNYVTRGL